MNPHTLKRILVIRRDNIGDLVCTTPLLRALRQQLPEARIEVLATRYNQAVLAHSPDIDALHFYIKAKHRAPGESVLSIHWQRLCMLYRLRRQRFDVAIIAGGESASARRLAHSVKARRIVVLDEADPAAGEHEVERCCHLLRSLGLRYETPPPRVVAAPHDGPDAATLHFGIHISARKPSQRWPAEKFSQLIRQLHARYPEARFGLLWAPGSEHNPEHPGDDEKAATILASLQGEPVEALPTQTLDALISALDRCAMVICADGGAMHLAAGLGKPIVCFFGQSDARRWHPWGVEHVLLQPPSLEVGDLSVAQVADAVATLQDARPPAGAA